MKQIFKPVSLSLIAMSAWITWVCASLLQFDDGGNLIARSYSVWGDWSAHFTFINGMRERGLSWIAGDNPLFPGVPFQYPFLSHFLTYLFSRITFMDTIHATYVLSLLLMFALPFLLYTAFRKLSLSPWGAFGSVAAFLLIGGFQWMDSGLKTTEPLTNQFDGASIFTQFILFEFFPQRAFLFGITLFLSCVIYAFQKKKWTLKSQVGFAVALSLGALFHIHTWIAIATILLLSFFMPPLHSEKKGFRKSVFIFGAGVAAFSGLFLAFLLLRGNGAAARMSWDMWLPGWAQNPRANVKRAAEMNLILFWIFNTGIYLPLAAFGIWTKRKDKSLWAIASAGCLLWLIAELFNIQPYYYDNLKLFTYSFLFLAPFVGFALETLASFKKFPKYLGPAIAILLLGVQVSAAVIDLNLFQNGIQKTLFFSVPEFAMAEAFKTLRASPDDIVLISPRHNHWVPCLTGNPVAMGFPGWLWSWGISYGQREKQINEVLLGRPNAMQVIESLKIRYAVLETHEKAENQPINLPYFESHFRKIMDRGGWMVYSLRDQAISPATSVR